MNNKDDNKLNVLDETNFSDDVDIIDSDITSHRLAWIVLRRLFTLPHVAIANGNEKGAFQSIIVLISQLENICIADEIVKPEYVDELELNESKDLLDQVMNSNKKLRALLKPLFKQNTKKKKAFV